MLDKTRYPNPKSRQPGDRIRIGMIGYALDRAAGGIGRYTRELIQALARLQTDITVLLSGAGHLDLPSVRLPGTGLLPGLLTIGQLEIAWTAWRRQFDILHDPTGALPIAIAPLPRVATIHDAIPYIYPQASTTLDWLIYRLWLPIAVRRFDAVITVSQQSKTDLIHYLRLNPELVHVIPEAANPHYSPRSVADIHPALQRAGLEHPYILFVGSLEPRKNLLRLLEAFADLCKWSTKWKLAIVGARNFWKSTPVVESVEKLDLKSRVIFTGFIPEDDLPSIYTGADLFVFPSLYEGFGLPVLEAMACGVPVVSSNTSSLPEVTGQAARLVDPYDIEELSAAMRAVLADPDLVQNLRHQGLERARLFSWQRTASETMKIYENVLNQA